VAGRRLGDVSLAPNVSLSRQPFIRLQQQMKLDQRDATASATNDVMTDNDITDYLSDTESISSDRRK